VQLGTLRFLGTFLAQVEETPAAVVGHVADQLAIPAMAWAANPASRARLVHTGEIRRAYGYVAYGDRITHRRFLRWMFDRAWTADDPASKLLDAATGWLVDHKVVLPGVTTITRLVAQVRDRANERAWRRLTGPLEPDRTIQLLSLLDVDADSGVSALERLRRPPRNPTIDGLVGALARLAEIKALGGDGIDTSRLPGGRLRQLAGEALAVNAQKVAQRSPARRLAVLAAFAASVHRSAHDDVIDVLLLVTREFTNRIQRKAEPSAISPPPPSPWPPWPRWSSTRTSPRSRSAQPCLPASTPRPWSIPSPPGPASPSRRRCWPS